MNWYSKINMGDCKSCGQCSEKGAHDVYDLDKTSGPSVIDPEGCVDHCHGYGNLCPVEVITYMSEDNMDSCLLK